MFNTKKILPLAVGMAAFLTAFAPIANASPIVFNTSENVGAPTRTTGAGSRGGCNLAEGNIEINLAAPTDIALGKTVSQNPTFYWTIESDIEVPLEFTLVVPDRAEPVFVKTFSAEEVQDGMMSIQLPEGYELEDGTLYRWTVSAICNANRRSNDVYAQSWIERVDAAEMGAGALGLVAARSYAQANLWYDALDALDADADRRAVMETYSNP